MKDVKWIEGAPEKLEPGMLVLWDSGIVEVVGTELPEIAEVMYSDMKAWAWLIQPHELEWVERMANAHGAGNQGKSE